MVTFSSDSDASPGNSPSRAGEANEEEDSLNIASGKDGQQAKGKKPKVTGPKPGPNKTDGKTNEKSCQLAILVNVLKFDL